MQSLFEVTIGSVSVLTDGKGFYDGTSLCEKFNKKLYRFFQVPSIISLINSVGGRDMHCYRKQWNNRNIDMVSVLLVVHLARWLDVKFDTMLTRWLVTRRVSDDSVQEDNTLLKQQLQDALDEKQQLQDALDNNNINEDSIQVTKETEEFIEKLEKKKESVNSRMNVLQTENKKIADELKDVLRDSDIDDDAKKRRVRINQMLKDSINKTVGDAWVEQCIALEKECKAFEEATHTKLKDLHASYTDKMMKRAREESENVINNACKKLKK
jgi:hypothetical protein